jgi:anti-anti-sigma factor
MNDLAVTVECSPTTITLYAAGPIDGNTAAALQEPLLAAVADTRAAVCLDLAQVSFMSIAGLRVLLLAAKARRTRGDQLRVTHVQPHIQNVLSIAGFTTFIDVVA